MYGIFAPHDYVVDHPDTLETHGLHGFDGELRWLGAFSAHPKLDAVTGELFNFGIDPFPSPRIRCYRVDRGGRLHLDAREPERDPVFVGRLRHHVPFGFHGTFTRRVARPAR